jgi:putative holliday junction resolvase
LFGIYVLLFIIYFPIFYFYLFIFYFSNLSILAVDYGKRKIGLAISDETNTIASKLPVLFVKIDTEIIEGILHLLKNLDTIDTILLGLPLGIDMKPTQMSLDIKTFAQKLKISIPVNINITFTNEVLSSKQAEKGRSRKFRNEKSDSEAARIFLQEYLDHLKYKNT